MSNESIIVPRGKARNGSLTTQVRDYSGLRFERNITPTDIDLAVDFGGRAFVFAELKFEGSPITTGQRKFFENLIYNLKRPAIVFVACHNAILNQEIDGEKAEVVEAYSNYKRQWVVFPKRIPLREAIESWRKTHHL